LAVSNFLARHGVEYLRVHDVEKNKLAIGEKRFRGFGF
jgi:dihydropteroate synthase